MQAPQEIFLMKDFSEAGLLGGVILNNLFLKALIFGAQLLVDSIAFRNKISLWRSWHGRRWALFGRGLIFHAIAQDLIKS